MHRRRFLASLLTTATATALPRMVWADIGNPAFLAAGKLTDDDFVLHGLTDKGESLFHLPLPARGHAAAAHPTLAEAVAFARRPGAYALVLDCATGAVRHRLTPPDGRQFNGHGVYSADGAVLMTSEQMADTSDGRIGLWSVPDGYRRIGEWVSGGIGPHDMKRLPDGSLVIANGGIATDATDRSKLNIDSMIPNLTLLSPDGTALDQVTLDPALHKNSIRHLGLTADGRIAFGMQWEGDLAEPVPLVGLWTIGAAPALFTLPEAEAFSMNGYIGSVAAQGDRIAVTSPRGGAVMIFDTAGSLLATHHRADICGVAPVSGGFIATDGAGGIWDCNETALSPLGQNGTQWDNHLVALT